MCLPAGLASPKLCEGAVGRVQKKKSGTRSPGQSKI